MATYQTLLSCHTPAGGCPHHSGPDVPRQNRSIGRGQSRTERLLKAGETSLSGDMEEIILLGRERGIYKRDPITVGEGGHYLEKGTGIFNMIPRPEPGKPGKSYPGLMALGAPPSYGDLFRDPLTNRWNQNFLEDLLAYPESDGPLTFKNSSNRWTAKKSWFQFLGWNFWLKTLIGAMLKKKLNLIGSGLERTGYGHRGRWFILKPLQNLPCWNPFF